MANQNLNRAKQAKNDEFYTQLRDIERELYHYRDHFKNKVVYCNCDDPRVSNFFFYFFKNFKFLGLKRLISTCYQNDNVEKFSEHKKMEAVYLDYDGKEDLGNDPDIKKIKVKPLKGDGDFRSEECIDLLKQADIVVTNPPFSLFREYVAQLIEYNKKFLIIGNMNAVTYKEVFPLIKENRLWLGYSPRGMDFKLPDGSLKNVNACWFTNLDHKKRHEELILVRRYNQEDYPKYDNYDAIEVRRVVNIPRDYDGVMGVPITFLDKYNPDQFELLWLASGHSKTTMPQAIKALVGFKEEVKSNYNTSGYGIVDGKQSYHRLLIRRKEANG